ncbi:MAG TPA: DUF2460 domain-containing protein [Bryobacteraceae bacterium]|nr:DUF2460 domain-containing protein [Bryobacteraceae bacterium]
MATFPKLKTGAVLQYPAGKSLRYAQETVRFVDGSEQRYRNRAAVRRRWTVRLDVVDEGELAELESFFLENQGAYGSFAFVDPWDGVEYEDCSLEDDSFTFRLVDGLRGQATLTVKQNRS